MKTVRRHHLFVVPYIYIVFKIIIVKLSLNGFQWRTFYCQVYIHLIFINWLNLKRIWFMMMMQYYNGIWHLWQILFKVVYPTVCRFWPADVFCNWWIKHTNNGCLRKCVHLPGNLNFGGYHDIYNLSRNSMVHTINDWSFLFISEIFKCYALNIYLARSFIHNLSFSNSCWLFVWYFRTSVRYFIILTFNNCFLLCIYMKHCFIMTLNFLNFYFMCENPFFIEISMSPPPCLMCFSPDLCIISTC